MMMMTPLKETERCFPGISCSSLSWIPTWLQTQSSLLSISCFRLLEWMLMNNLEKVLLKMILWWRRFWNWSLIATKSSASCNDFDLWLFITCRQTQNQNHRLKDPGCLWNNFNLDFWCIFCASFISFANNIPHEETLRFSRSLSLWEAWLLKTGLGVAN